MNALTVIDVFCIRKSMQAKSRLIKKYPNRRLYDTATSSYIKLGDIKKLVLEQVAFRIVDGRTYEDLTHSVLLQVIVEEENAAQPIFSSQLLAQIIRFYGNAMQEMLGTYLEENLQAFAQIQRRLQEQSGGRLDDNPMPDAAAWRNFVIAQRTTIEGLMTSYLDQSAQSFLDMQRQFQEQSRSMFEAFRFSDTRTPESPASANRAPQDQTKPREGPEGEEQP